MQDTQKKILEFWFEETEPVAWFQTNPDFDMRVAELFADIYRKGCAGLYDGWQDDSDGCLALCLLFDQFPRNMFRGAPQAFATDARALEIAGRALARGYDQLVPILRRRFLYLPYEHSEKMEDQERAVVLFAGMKDDDPLGYDYALRHRDVIARFGRFPHRNAILGRENTAEEKAYLAEPGAGF